MGQSVALFRLQAASVYPRQELLVQGNPRYHKGSLIPFALYHYYKGQEEDIQAAF